MTNNLNLIMIRFTKPHPPYLADERAGFSPAIAQQLVQMMHVAEYVDPPPGLTPKAKPVGPEEAEAAEKQRAAAIKSAEADEKKKATAEKRRLAAAARRAKKKAEKAEAKKK